MYKIKGNNDVEKIDAVYCFNNTTDMGYYDSYRNFCKKNMVYFTVVYGSEKVRVNSTPEKILVSANNSERIRALAAEKISELKEVSHEGINNFKKYILIVYVDGQKKYFEYKEGFEEIFEIYEPETSTQVIKFVNSPYLIFETKVQALQAEIIESISNCINNKRIKELFELISEDCILEVSGNKHVGVKEIKKEYKRKAGFLNINLLNASLYAIIEGTIDNNKNSILVLNLKIDNKRSKEADYIVHMDFNQNYKINRININRYERESIASKILLGEDLRRIKRGNYNDFK